MKFMFGSQLRDKVICTLSKNPGLSLKDLSNILEEKYVSIYKIIKELLASNYVICSKNKYYLSSKFICSFSTIENNLLVNYHDELFLHKKANLYNLVKIIDDSKKVNSMINNYLEDFVFEKFYSLSKQYFDLKNKEFDSIVSIIENEFELRDVDVLEVNCSLGKISKNLSNKVNSLTSIDSNKTFIDYNNRKNNHSNVKFINSSFENFTTSKKYDVILFSWEGFHLKQRESSILDKIKSFATSSTLVIIVDSYPYSEFSNLTLHGNYESAKVLYSQKEELHNKILKEFKNLKNEIFFTYHEFDSISKITELIKIQQCIFGNCTWNLENENSLKYYILKKENPLIIADGFWISSFKLLS